MMIGIALVVGILAAACVMVVAGVTDFVGFDSQLRNRRSRTARGALVECPATGRVTRIRVSFDPTTRIFALMDCERLGSGRVRCDRECLPSLN